MKVLPFHTRHVRIELYEIDVHIVIGKPEDYAEFMHAEFDELEDVTSPSLAGRCLMQEGHGRVVIYIRRARERDIRARERDIAHECFYATMFIAEERKLKYDNYDHEHLAYLHCYLVSEVYAAIKAARAKKGPTT